MVGGEVNRVPHSREEEGDGIDAFVRAGLAPPICPRIFSLTRPVSGSTLVQPSLGIQSRRLSPTGIACRSSWGLIFSALVHRTLPSLAEKQTVFRAFQPTV